MFNLFKSLLSGKTKEPTSSTSTTPIELSSPTFDEFVWNEWSVLPPEIWGVIIQFLPPPSILHLSMTNKRFHFIIGKETSREVQISGKSVEFAYINEKYYLPLPFHGKKDNYGTYYVSERGKHTGFGKETLYSIFHMIQIDPKTLMVKNGDFTFAKTTGKVNHHPDQVGVPLGTAFDCAGIRSHKGQGGINLKGTIFYVKSEFRHAGCCSEGSWTFSENQQVVKLTGVWMGFSNDL